MSPGLKRILLYDGVVEWKSCMYAGCLLTIVKKFYKPIEGFLANYFKSKKTSFCV